MYLVLPFFTCFVSNCRIWLKGILFTLFTSCAEFKTAAVEKLTQTPQNWGYVLEHKNFKFLLYLTSQ